MSIFSVHLTVFDHAIAMAILSVHPSRSSVFSRWMKTEYEIGLSKV